MSLINDALKKAQKQRSGEAPPLAAMPTIGGEAATRIAKRGRPTGFNTLLVRGGVGLAVAVVLVGGGLFLFRDRPAPAADNPPAPKSAETPAPAAAAPAPTATAPAPAPTQFVVPIATPTKTAPAPAATTTVATPAKVEPTPPAAPVAAPVAAQPAPPKVAAPPAKLGPRAIAFIENLRVVGIRASATDSKVLMNDRVYRVGDTVEHEMDLKLTGITSSSLTFEDEQGARYTRNF